MLEKEAIKNYVMKILRMKISGFQNIKIVNVVMDLFINVMEKLVKLWDNVFVK